MIGVLMSCKSPLSAQSAMAEVGFGIFEHRDELLLAMCGSGRAFNTCCPCPDRTAAGDAAQQVPLGPQEVFPHPSGKPGGGNSDTLGRRGEALQGGV